MPAPRDSRGNIIKPRKGNDKGGVTTTPAPPTGPTPPAPIFPKADATYKSIASALLPTLSRTDSSSLSTLYGISALPDRGKPGSMEPREITGGLRNSYLSQDRATQALNAIGGLGGNGPGVSFLKSAITLLQKYGGTGLGEGMSRANYNQFNTEFTNLLNSVQGDKAVAPYADLAQMFLNPTFKAGGLMQSDKTGAPIPGKKFYT